MADMLDSNGKIIHFSKRQRKALDDLEQNIRNAPESESFKSDEKNVLKSEFLKKFPCVKLTKDNNANYFNAAVLKEYAQKVSYIVSVMRSGTPGAVLYRYKIPSCFLCEFLNLFKNSNEIDGIIIDIEKYIPDDLA